MTGEGAELSRWHWRNWPVLVKLVAVLLVPTVVALVVGVLRIVDEAGAVPSYTRISQVTHVQQKLSGLIGELQRERDLATTFVATGRLGDRAPLDRQFGVVDTRAAVAREAADQVRDLGPTGYVAVLQDLRALRPLRQSVLNGSGPVEVVVSEYGAAVDPLIDLDASLVRQLDDVAVADDAAASHALLTGREQVSRQHAIILAALYADQISPPQIDDVRAAAVRLGTVQDEFSAALDPAERAERTARAFGDAELSRQRLMQLVLDRGLANSALDISPLDWSARTTATTTDLAGAENDLRQRVDRTALRLRDDARSTAGWNAVILVLLLGLGVVLGLVIARSMLGPLGVLKRTALDVAGRRLPDAMAQVRAGDVPDQSVEPVAVGTREEIGQVARAFDEVYSQAIRLAGEQAKLRAHINDIFVNLSRRSQSLVERQLQLIDRLESGEQDPDQLDNLFQLDHLATRMRRNSDNLLVLAGTEATKRTSRPVRLVDVLRAAVSEVEQYQRLVLQQPPTVLVLGRTAADLVHLLAELLDNATQFSPPDTHVMVSAELAQDGSVSIEVMDRGVGMTEAEVDQANERLASTPVVDASVSRRMGLFVVGRLAIRHGLGIRLRRGDDGIGICASVTMPPRLVRPVPDSGDPRIAGGAASALPAPRALPAGDTAGTDPMLAAGIGAPPVTPEHLNGLGSYLTNGHGAGSSNGGRPNPQPETPDPGAPDAGAPDAAAADAGAPDPDVSGPRPGDLPRRAGDRSVSAPARATPSLSSGAGLQDSTPIFDDVASAWFQEHHEGPPVRWAEDAGPDRQPADQDPAAQRPDSDAAPPAPPAPLGQTPAHAPAPQPAVAEPVPHAHPAPAARQQGWGAADGGWRAAQALATPETSGERTSAGLPRRTPRALLVPGAIGTAEQVAPVGVPVRSAEVIRGRLSSYQRGIREGRRTRRAAASGSYQQQDTEEETK